MSDFFIRIYLPLMACFARMMLLFFLAGAAAAGTHYSSKENWQVYLNHCALKDDIARVKKQMEEGSDVLFTQSIETGIERVDDLLKNVDLKDRNKGKVADCRSQISEAKKLMIKAGAYDEGVKKRWAREARDQHEKSPLYKESLRLGYKDYGYIEAIYSDYQEYGEEKIKDWVYLVGDDCGRYHKAVQYLKPYYIYLASKGTYSTCDGRSRIAVLLPVGAKVNKGAYIDRGTAYVFAGVLDASQEGFPIQLLILKRVLPRNQ